LTVDPPAEDDGNEGFLNKTSVTTYLLHNVGHYIYHRLDRLSMASYPLLVFLGASNTLIGMVMGAR